MSNMLNNLLDGRAYVAYTAQGTATAEIIDNIGYITFAHNGIQTNKITCQARVIVNHMTDHATESEWVLV